MDSYWIIIKFCKINKIWVVVKHQKRSLICSTLSSKQECLSHGQINMKMILRKSYIWLQIFSDILLKSSLVLSRILKDSMPMSSKKMVPLSTSFARFWQHQNSIVKFNLEMLQIRLVVRTTRRLLLSIGTTQRKQVILTTTPKICQIQKVTTHKNLLLSLTGQSPQCTLLPSKSLSTIRTRNQVRRT